MAIPEAMEVPRIGSLLISAPSDCDDECSLCGNSFEIDETSRLAGRLPCVDNQCDPCAKMWRILRSPTCLVCYGDFKCPRLYRKAAQRFLPHLNVDTRDRFQQQSPLDSDMDSFLSFRDRHATFHNANAGSSVKTISTPGSPMAIDDDEFPAMTDCVDANHQNTQHPNTDNLDFPPPKRNNRTTKAKSHGCMYCRRTFRSSSHLRQHMIVHSPAHRTCKVCDRVLGNANSRRIHERRHRETVSERETRLGKAKVARDQVRAGQRNKRQ